MRYISAFVFLLLCQQIYSQDSLHFSAEGKVTGKPQKGLQVVPSDTLLTKQLTVEQIREIKKEVSHKIANTIDNLQDEKLKLAVTYNQIWDTSFTKEILKELILFKKYLDDAGGAIPAECEITYKYLPNPKEFDAALKKPVYAIDPDNSGKVFNAQKLVFVNPYKTFLLGYLESTMRTDNIDKVKMDIEYKKGWRDLEALYKEGEDALARIKASLQPCVPASDTTVYNTTIHKLKKLAENKDNYIQKLLAKDFFKKWLWYTEGYLFMNPFAATTKERRYPSTEEISQLKEDKNFVVLTDSAETALTDVWLTTKRVKNEALAAKTNKTDKYYYDAANNYESINKNELPKSRDDRKGITVVVYNVPQKENLSSSTDKSKEDSGLGTVVQNMSDASSGASLTSIVSNAATWIASWKKVNGSFNGFQEIPYRKDIDFPNTKAKVSGARENRSLNALQSIEQEYASFSSKLLKEFLQPAGTTMTQKNGQKSAPATISPQTTNDAVEKMITQQNDFFNSLVKLYMQEADKTPKEFYVKIKGREILATKKSDLDKLNFIIAGFKKDKTANCEICDTLPPFCIIDSFLVKDNCFPLIYKNNNTLEKDVDSVLKRFQCYAALIDSSKKSLRKKYNSIAKDYLPVIRAYISITHRSLPPVLSVKNNSIVEAKISKDTAEYRTVVFERSIEALPAPPKKILYSVTSSLPGKVTDGKNPGEPNIVIEHSYRYGKRHWVDFSVGLAFNTAEYQLKTIPDGGSLPKVSEAERFRPIAGMHIYPTRLGLLKSDDKLATLTPSSYWRKLSLFVGVGLSKSLENLYPAISYDVVPGIRVMWGLHFYKDTRYTIANNQIINQASAYQKSGGFISLNLEPVAFASLIGLIK